MDIDEEIKFPTRDSEWVTKILIGGFLGTIPVIGFLAGGYYMTVLKNAIEETPGMPKWDNWGKLFIIGLFVFIIELIYLIIPVIVAAAPLAGIIYSAISSGDVGFGIIGAAIGGIMISIVLFLVISFFIPMALAMYIRNDSIRAAFRIGEIFSRIRSVFSDYLTVYLIMLLLFFILILVTTVPILGPLIFIFGKFYILVAAANMFGKVYARSGSA